jgi:hypothetical protein
MKKSLMLLLFFWFIAPIFGQDGDSAYLDQQSGIFSDTGSVSFQSSEYMLICILVEDLQGTLDIWNVPDSQGFPKISTVTKIKRNEPISVFLVFATERSEINMMYDFKTLRPDGTFSNNVYKGLEIAKGNSPDNLMYKAKQLPVIIFDETDSLGKYQFYMDLFDNNSLITRFILEFDLIE